MKKGLALAVILTTPITASAQDPGERVRVTLPTARFVAIVTEARPAALVVVTVDDEDSRLRTVAYDDIRQLERSLGMHRRGVMKWSMFGTLGGAGFGALLGAGAFGEIRCGGTLFSSGSVCSGEAEIIVAVAAAFGLLGAGAGALFGALGKAEAWEAIEFNVGTETRRLLVGVRLRR